MTEASEDEQDQNAEEDGIEIRKENGKTYIYQDGEKLTGTRLVGTDDVTYYLKKGMKSTKTGTVKVKGTSYTLKKGVVQE